MLQCGIHPVESDLMKPTILMVPRLPARMTALLSERYSLLGPMSVSTPEALPEGAAEAAALVTMGSLSTDAGLIDALPNLRLISCYGTGIEGVDQVHAKSRGILLSNGGDANAASVAEFAVAAMLATARNLVAGDRFVRAGRWQGNSVERMPPVPGFAGRRVGIFGLGSIGGRIAALLGAFGVEIGYHNRSPKPELPYLYHPTLVGLAEWADILVVAVRASAETRHAINAEILRALGPQGHLVNISRGIAVDELALCGALEAGGIAGAALDVFENEPEVPERLKALDTVILTPHIASSSEAAQIAQQDLLLRNLDAFFAGRPLVSPVPL